VVLPDWGRALRPSRKLGGALDAIRWTDACSGNSAWKAQKLVDDSRQRLAQIRAGCFRMVRITNAMRARARKAPGWSASKARPGAIWAWDSYLVLSG